MNIQKNISLKAYNTFGIEAKAAYFVEISNTQDLIEVLASKEHPNRLLLSGGSNMLITGDLDLLVVYLNIKGKEVIQDDGETVVIKVMAGENWHELVLWCLERGFGGLENLSLIPGNAGTAPIQNIGAYGVELKDVFESCEAIEIKTQKVRQFSKEDCAFGYRDSFFKGVGKNKFVISSINLRLLRKNQQLNTSYGAIESELQHRGITAPTIKDVSDAVVAIRQRKLPDPKVLGNSGSFFKNPVLSANAFTTFIEKNPDAPYYELEDSSFKVPAGWLIEQCGFKGKRYGDAGVHKNQALVLVNYGKASGKEILDLAKRIQRQVFQKFNIEIQPEVNIIGG